MKFYSREYIPSSTKMALELIPEAICDELGAAEYYDALTSLATTKHDKIVLSSIAQDERKHAQMFKNIYYTITNTLPDLNCPENKLPNEYIKGMEFALMDEIKAVEMYRVIMRGLPYIKPFQDMMYEIITDEQKHADLLNYLIMEANYNFLESGTEAIIKRLGYRR
jgi:rubrerythrin